MYPVIDKLIPLRKSKGKERKSTFAKHRAKVSETSVAIVGREKRQRISGIDVSPVSCTSPRLLCRLRVYHPAAIRANAVHSIQ